MARTPEDRPADALELERELALFDPGGDSAPPSTWEPSMSGGEVSTLILPRGSVDRAKAMAKQAARARPFAVLLSGASAVYAAAVVGLFVTGLQTLDGAPRTPVEQSAAWLLSAAAAIGALSVLTRWLSHHWSSAPEVLRVDKILSRGLFASAIVYGGWELVSRGLDALDGATTALHGWALLSRAVTLLAVAGLAGWSAQRRR